MEGGRGVKEGKIGEKGAAGNGLVNASVEVCVRGRRTYRRVFNDAASSDRGISVHRCLSACRSVRSE